MSADRLREALRKFGRHLNSCKAFPAISEAQVAMDCTCGLQAALAENDAPAPTVNSTIGSVLREKLRTLPRMTKHGHTWVPLRDVDDLLAEQPPAAVAEGGEK